MNDQGNRTEPSEIEKGPKRYYRTPVRKLVRSTRSAKKISKNDSHALGASFMYKQSLKDNNLKLAKALDDSKQDNAKLEKVIMELKQEKSELEAYNSILRRNAKPINDELEIEVQRRIELRMEKVRRYIESSAEHLRHAADRMNEAAEICDLTTEVHNIDQIVKDTLEFSQHITPDHTLKSSKLGNKISIYSSSRTPLASKNINLPSGNTENLKLPSESPECDEDEDVRISRLSDVSESAELDRRSGQYFASRSKRRTRRISNNVDVLEPVQSAAVPTSPQPLPTLHTGQIADQLQIWHTEPPNSPLSSECSPSKPNRTIMTSVDMSLDSPVFLRTTSESMSIISPSKMESSDSFSSEKPTATVTVQKKPAASVTVKEKPTASVTLQEKPTASVTVQEKPTGSVTVREKPTPSVTVQEKPAASVTVQGKPADSVSMESPKKHPTRTSSRISASVKPNYQELISPEILRSQPHDDRFDQTTDTQGSQSDSEPVRQVEIRCKAGQFKVVVGDRDGGPVSRSKKRKTKSLLRDLQEPKEARVYDFTSTPPNSETEASTNAVVPEKSFSVFDLSCTAEKITNEIPYSKQLHYKQKEIEAKLKQHNKKRKSKAVSKKHSVKTEEIELEEQIHQTEENNKQPDKCEEPVKRKKHSREHNEKCSKRKSETKNKDSASYECSRKKSGGENHKNITNRRRGKSSLKISEKHDNETVPRTEHDEILGHSWRGENYDDDPHLESGNFEKVTRVDKNENIVHVDNDSHVQKRISSEKSEEKSESSEHIGSPKRARRAAATNIDFKEPSLNSKLRKGDKFTYALDQDEVQKDKKKKKAVKRKSKLSN